MGAAYVDGCFEIFGFDLFRNRILGIAWSDTTSFPPNTRRCSVEAVLIISIAHLQGFGNWIGSTERILTFYHGWYTIGMIQFCYDTKSYKPSSLGNARAARLGPM